MNKTGYSSAIYVLVIVLGFNSLVVSQAEAAKKVKKPVAAKNASFNLKIVEGFMIDIVDMKMVNSGNPSEFSSEYIQEITDFAPQYAKEACDGKLKSGSEVLVKNGSQTLGVSNYGTIVSFQEQSQRTGFDGKSFPYWRYTCFLQADFSKVKKVAFYDIYVNGIRKKTEPYANLASSKFELVYPSTKVTSCITGDVGVMRGLLSCS